METGIIARDGEQWKSLRTEQDLVGLKPLDVCDFVFAAGKQPGYVQKSTRKPCNDGAVRRLQVVFPSPDPKIAFSCLPCAFKIVSVVSAGWLPRSSQ